MKGASKKIADDAGRETKKVLVQAKLVPDASTFSHEPSEPKVFGPEIKISHWNVNSLPACSEKEHFKNYYSKNDFDIICFNETKLSFEKFKKLEFSKHEFWFNKYFQYWNFSTRRLGYSGVTVMTKEKPLSVKYDIGGLKDFDLEGRAITLEFPLFYFVYVYVPNAGSDLARLEPRTQVWDSGIINHLETLKKQKGVILLGDLNVAPEDMDLTNPKSNVKSPGFTPEEREKFRELKSLGYIDCFRELNPKTVKYTWWSQLTKTARTNNIGWRIDHCVTDSETFKRVKDVALRNDVWGSDHCPVEVTLNLTK